MKIGGKENTVPDGTCHGTLRLFAWDFDDLAVRPDAERENAAVFALVEQVRQQYPQVDEDAHTDAKRRF